MTATPQTSKTIVVPNVQLSYAYLARPHVSKDAQTGKETSKYETDGCFPATHPAFEIIKAAQREVARAAWGDAPQQFPLGPPNEFGQATMVTLPNWEGVLRVLMLEGKIPLRDGNKRKKQEEPYVGNFYIAARSQRQPTIAVTRQGVNVNIGPDDPQFPYSGCFANLIVDIWAQDTLAKKSPYGKRINCQLTGVQYVSKGTKFGGGGRTANLDEFDLSPTDADAAPPGAPAGDSGPSLV